MKKRLLLALVFGVFLLFSCNKKEQSQVSQPEIYEEFEPADVSGIVNRGYVLRVNSGLLAIDDDTGEETNKTRWVESMSLGETILTGETRRATFSSDGVVYDFIEIKRENGKEGYAFAMQVAVGGQLAVVIDEKANLYRSPKVVDVSGTILSRRTVVVYYPEAENGGFVEVRAYDPERQAYIRTDNNYIRYTSISETEADVQSAILLQTALPLRESNSAEKTRRDALLESALQFYPDSEFYMEILELVHPETAGFIQDVYGMDEFFEE